MVYFTSDPHFGHKNIIKYCDRPWESPAKMDRALIDIWNKTVTPNDEVFVIGDFSLSKNKEYIRSIVDRLNGTKHLILGNHDELGPFDYVDVGFASVHTSLKLKDGMYLVHDPAAATVLNRGDTLLCGHVHTMFKKISSLNGVLCVNVGVDVWDYKPMTLEGLLNDG